jgi:hypothetical protein
MNDTKRFRVDAPKRFIHGVLVEAELSRVQAGRLIQVTVLEDRNPWFKGDKAHVFNYELIEESA